MAGHALAVPHVVSDGESGSPQEPRQAWAEAHRALLYTVFQASPPPDFSAIQVPVFVSARYNLKDPTVLRITGNLWQLFGTFIEHKRVEGHGSLLQVGGKGELPPDFMEIFAVAESLIQEGGTIIGLSRMQEVVRTQNPAYEKLEDANKMAVALLLALAYANSARLHAHSADVKH